jgi:hypothetical protein
MASKLPDGMGLGCIAKDSITGFEGVVIAITEWLNGCIRITIQPKLLNEGKPLDSHTFDVEQVDVVKPIDAAIERERTGGPSLAPTRAADPR